jgi:hypothetical protein
VLLIMATAFQYLLLLRLADDWVPLAVEVAAD